MKTESRCNMFNLYYNLSRFHMKKNISPIVNKEFLQKFSTPFSCLPPRLPGLLPGSFGTVTALVKRVFGTENLKRGDLCGLFCFFVASWFKVKTCRMGARNKRNPCRLLFPLASLLHSAQHFLRARCSRIRAAGLFGSLWFEMSTAVVEHMLLFCRQQGAKALHRIPASGGISLTSGDSFDESNGREAHPSTHQVPSFELWEHVPFIGSRLSNYEKWKTWLPKLFGENWHSKCLSWIWTSFASSGGGGDGASWALWRFNGVTSCATKSSVSGHSLWPKTHDQDSQLFSGKTLHAMFEWAMIAIGKHFVDLSCSRPHPQSECCQQLTQFAEHQ